MVHKGKIWSWQGTEPGNDEPTSANWQDVGDAVAQAGAVAGRVGPQNANIFIVDLSEVPLGFG